MLATTTFDGYGMDKVMRTNDNVGRRRRGGGGEEGEGGRR